KRLLQHRPDEPIAARITGVEAGKRLNGQARVDPDRTLSGTGVPTASSSRLLRVGLACQGQSTAKQILQMPAISSTQVKPVYLGPAVGHDERLQRPGLVVVPTGSLLGHQVDLPRTDAADQLAHQVEPIRNGPVCEQSLKQLHFMG